MAKKYDRVGTTTNRVVEYLAVLVKQAKFDKKNPNVESYEVSPKETFFEREFYL